MDSPLEEKPVASDRNQQKWCQIRQLVLDRSIRRSYGRQTIVVIYQDGDIQDPVKESFEREVR